jgi:hypothetical protein
MTNVGTSPVREAPVGAAASSTVEFLDASSARDRGRWLDHWSRWPQRDVMAHPEFGRLFARPHDRVIAAAMRTATGGILYPVVVRPLAAEPWAGKETRSSDLTTPYGYGGPFAWGATAADAQRFWSRFDEWAAEQGAATSFARLSLFPGRILPFNGQTVVHGPNVVRRVDLSPEELWSDYRSGARRNIDIARRVGVQVEFDADGKRLGEFLEVYASTMDRCGAAPGYYFPRSFFETLVRQLGGHLTFAHAIVGGKVVASEIVLLSSDHAVSFLGGTLPAGLPIGAAALIKHEIFLWCRERGMKAVVLGGGYRPDDGVLRFKRQFGRAIEVPFLLGLKTYDVEESRRLLEARRQWERGQGREWTPAPTYFPEYRS